MTTEYLDGMSIDDFDELTWAWNRHMRSEPWLTELKRDPMRQEQKKRMDEWLKKRFKEICEARKPK